LTGAADFWSRRKAQVAAEEVAEAREAETEAAAARDAALDDKTDAEICEELGLPDFRAFMARAVPERLRRRALRRLWLSNPALANLDGMIDYGEDFTDSACVIEGMQTAYQVGKGMLAHVQEMARQAEAEAQAEAQAEAGEDDAQEHAETPEAEPAPLAMTEAASVPEVVPAPTEAVETGDAEMDEAAPLPPRRRMRFAFAETAGEQA
jgi:hypothetical protein